MNRRPPKSTRTYMLFPYTPRVRSPLRGHGADHPHGPEARRPPAGDRRPGGDADRRRGWCRRARLSELSAGKAEGPEQSGPFFVPWLPAWVRSEEHTSELQSLMRISYVGFCLKTKKKQLTYIY